MRLLVTGCPRSGTTWMAEAICSTGVDCGHELVFAPEIKRRNKPARWGDGEWVAESSAHAAPHTPFLDTYVVHLTRHPVKVIASIAHHGGVVGARNSPGVRYMRSQVPEIKRFADPVRRAAEFWVRWNRLVAADVRVRLEDVTAADITRFARIADPDACEATLPPPRNVAKHELPPISWDDVRDVPGLMEMAAEYGYADS